MAAGKASVSASGAAMSKYDVEVEARLQALEKAVKALEGKCEAKASSGGGDVGARLDDLIARLNKKFRF